MEAILYDPVTENYYTPTRFNEYGVAYGENLGRPGAEDGFRWQVDWSSTKLVNYITFGGTYPNQPQPNSMWRISYLRNGTWTVLEEGKGGWIDSASMNGAVALSTLSRRMRSGCRCTVTAARIS